MNIKPDMVKLIEKETYSLKSNPKFEIVFHFFSTGGELYSGTVSDFSGSDALIYRDNLRTEQYDLKHLNCKFSLH